MKSTVLLAAAIGLCTATLALAQTPAASPKTQGPGVQAAADAREPQVLATCKHPPPAPRPFGNGAPPANPGPATYEISAIPRVVAAGTRWKMVWRDDGNNADGIIASNDGGLLIAQNDKSDVVKIDADGHATVVYRDTHTGGALSQNKKGQLFIDERELNAAIWELKPQHKLFANKYQGDSFDCIGGVLNDLAAASNGGVYFTMGGLYYAAPNGVVTRYGRDLRTNGIILSRDEKTLYVTNTSANPSTLVALDVQPDGSLTNQRNFATLPGGGGDGGTIDSEGRLYVSATQGIVVISPDGSVLGTIPVPLGVISVAFSGPGKQTLYAVLHERNGKPGIPGVAGAEVVAMPMLSHGYAARSK